MTKLSWMLTAIALIVMPLSVVNATECLETETIASGGYSAIDTSPGCEGTCPGLDLVIEDAHTWAKTWARNWANVSPAPDLPAVDFRRQFVIAAFMGQRPTTGYGVSVDCVSETGLASIGAIPLTVTITDTSPGVNCIVQPSLTRPFQFVVLDRPTSIFGRARIAVTFVHEAETTFCDDDDDICRICPNDDGIGDIDQNIDIIIDDSIPCCP